MSAVYVPQPSATCGDYRTTALIQARTANSPSPYATAAITLAPMTAEITGISTTETVAIPATADATAMHAFALRPIFGLVT